MSSFVMNSASGRRVDLLNPVDIHPHDVLHSTSRAFHPDAIVNTAPGPNREDGAFNVPTPTRAASTTPRTSPAADPTPGKRIYQCQECLKIFSTSGHLTRHSKVHSGEKNHICPFPECQRRCSRRDNLLQHYTMHLTKEERDLPTTYVRDALAQMQSRTGTYVHPYPRGMGPNGTAARFTQSPTSALPSTYIPPGAGSQYRDHGTFVMSEHSTSPSVAAAAVPVQTAAEQSERTPTPVHKLAARRTSSSSSAETLGPITPPMAVANAARHHYMPEMKEERGFQVSSVRGTL